MSQDIADQLLGAMRAGCYRPGDALPTEAELARQFGVSKPTLRESLRRLAALGVLTITHGHRAVVCVPGAAALACFIDLSVAVDPDGLREAVEFRAGLETECAAHAAERASTDDLSQLGALIEQMGSGRADPARWEPLHAQFHLALAHASGNRLFASMHQALSNTIVLTSRHLRQAQPQRDADATFQRHLELFEAVRSGDPLRARAAMAHHFTVAAAVIACQARARRAAASPDLPFPSPPPPQEYS